MDGSLEQVGTSCLVPNYLQTTTVLDSSDNNVQIDSRISHYLRKGLKGVTGNSKIFKQDTEGFMGT